MNRIYLSLAAITLILIAACSSTETVAVKEKVVASIYPAWYQQSGFYADSSSFAMSATAVASDSVTAIQRAENESRMLLESYISKEMEKVRTTLERAGSKSVNKADFILALRNAHAAVEKEAQAQSQLSTKTEMGYRGFARVDITKAKLDELMKKGFAGKSAYWKEFSSSEAYQTLVN